MNYPKTVPIKGRVRVCLELLRSQIIKGKVILDVGSTFGWLAREIQEDNPKKYIGIEPNENAVKFARKNVKTATFVKGDAAHIPVKDNTADIAVFFDVIEHVPPHTEAQCLKEIHRILKPNGILLLSTPYNHTLTKLLDPAWYFGHRHYSKHQLSLLLKTAGFKLKKFEVRGTSVSLMYMICFYMSKWVLKLDLNGSFLQVLDDVSYDKEGITTVYLVAEKTS